MKIYFLDSAQHELDRTEHRSTLHVTNTLGPSHRSHYLYLPPSNLSCPGCCCSLSDSKLVYVMTSLLLVLLISLQLTIGLNIWIGVTFYFPSEFQYIFFSLESWRIQACGEDFSQNRDWEVRQAAALPLRGEVVGQCPAGSWVLRTENIRLTLLTSYRVAGPLGTRTGRTLGLALRARCWSSVSGRGRGQCPGLWPLYPAPAAGTQSVTSWHASHISLIEWSTRVWRTVTRTVLHCSQRCAAHVSVLCF